jgi:WD40 repeat protein
MLSATLLFETELVDSPAGVAWAPDGRALAVGLTGGEIALIDPASPADVVRFSAHQHGLFALAWHPRRPLLATVGQDGRGRLWAGQQARSAASAELPAAAEWVEHVAWQPDGKHVAIAAGRAVSVFNDQGDLVSEHRFPDSTVGAITWRPQGAQLAIAGYNGLEIHNPLDSRTRPQRLSWRGSLLSLAWSPDSRVIAAGCQDNTVHFWRLREKRNSQMTGYEAKPRCLDWSPNSRWLATSGSRDLTLWPFGGGGPEGRAPTLLRRHRDPITALRFAPKGRFIASGCKAGYLCIWDTFEDFAPPATVMGLDAGIEALAWHPDPRQPVLACITRYGSVSVFKLGV